MSIGPLCAAFSHMGRRRHEAPDEGSQRARMRYICRRFGTTSSHASGRRALPTVRHQPDFGALPPPPLPRTILAARSTGTAPVHPRLARGGPDGYILTTTARLPRAAKVWPRPPPHRPLASSPPPSSAPSRRDGRVSRHRPFHLATLNGVGLSEPSTTRAAAPRSKDWSSRHLGSDLDVVRPRLSPREGRPPRPAGRLSRAPGERPTRLQAAPRPRRTALLRLLGRRHGRPSQLHRPRRPPRARPPALSRPATHSAIVGA